MATDPYEIRQDPRAVAAPRATTDFQSWSVRRQNYTLTVYGNYFKQDAYLNVTLNAAVQVFDLDERPLCTFSMMARPFESLGYLKDRMRGSDWELFDAIETDLEEIKVQIAEWLRVTYDYAGPL